MLGSRPRSTHPAADAPAADPIDRTAPAAGLPTFTVTYTDGSTDTIHARRMTVREGVYWFFDGARSDEAHTTIPTTSVRKCQLGPSHPPAHA